MLTEAQKRFLKENLFLLLEEFAEDENPQNRARLIEIITGYGPTEIASYKEDEQSGWTMLHRCAAENWWTPLSLLFQLHYIVAAISQHPTDWENELDGTEDTGYFDVKISQSNLEIIEKRYLFKENLIKAYAFDSFTSLVDIQDNNGNTALDHATRLDRQGVDSREAILLLLAVGARVTEQSIEEASDYLKPVLYSIKRREEEEQTIPGINNQLKNNQKIFENVKEDLKSSSEEENENIPAVQEDSISSDDEDNPNHNHALDEAERIFEQLRVRRKF